MFSVSRKARRAFRTNSFSTFEQLESRQLMSATIIDSGNGSTTAAGVNILGTTSQGVLYTADKSGTTAPELWLATGINDTPVLLAQDFGVVKGVLEIGGKLYLNTTPLTTPTLQDAGQRIVVTDGTVDGTHDLFTPVDAPYIRLRGTLDNNLIFQTGQISGNHSAVLHSLTTDGTDTVLVPYAGINMGSRQVQYTFAPHADSVTVSWTVFNGPNPISGTDDFDGVFTNINAMPHEVTFNDVIYTEDAGDLSAEPVGALGTATLQDGVLKITATDQSDSLLVDRTGGQFRVNLNGKLFYFNSAGVSLIRVSGGDGSDTIRFASTIRNQTIIHAGAGDDSVTGGTGRDRIYGDDGNDWVHGANGNDVLFGGLGQDLMYGGNGNDQFFGGADDDILHGDSGNDQIHGEAGLDQLLGGSGNDVLDQG